MIYIVHIISKAVLFKVDAWDMDADAKVSEYISNNHLTEVRRGINFNGDMIVQVD